MSRSMVKLACGILIMLVIMVSASACATEPDYANQIAEDILLAINENDYAKFSEHFDEAMKSALPEATFQQNTSQIKEAIGDYVSKTFWKTVTEGGYTAVYYKAKFTLEDEITVKVVFLETEGKVYVSGLWFS
jgi:hypothetical protein